MVDKSEWNEIPLQGSCTVGQQLSEGSSAQKDSAEVLWEADTPGSVFLEVCWLHPVRRLLQPECGKENKSLIWPQTTVY